MSAVFLLQQCLIGLTNGGLIALVAIGYTMVYGVLRFINFAHGDVIMLGACAALALVGPFGLAPPGVPPTPATWLGIAGLVLLCGLFCGGLSLAIDRLVYRPLRDAPPLAPLVSSIGVSFICMNIGLAWIGPADRGFPQVLPTANLLPGKGVQFGWKELLVVAVAVPLIVAIMMLMRTTRLGKALRAVVQDRTAAALVGIDIDRAVGTTFFLAGFLGGAASVVASLYTNTIGYQMGFQSGLYALTAAVLGGLGSIRGAVAGGLVVGLVRALSTAYAGERWAGAIVFALLIVVLVFRPEGLLGRRERERE